MKVTISKHITITGENVEVRIGATLSTLSIKCKGKSAQDLTFSTSILSEMREVLNEATINMAAEHTVLGFEKQIREA